MMTSPDGRRRTWTAAACLAASLLGACSAWAQPTLADNSWTQVTLAPTSRFIPITSGPQVMDVPDTQTANPHPRTRAYSGLIAGGNRIWYWGGAHMSYPANDLEVFDPVAMKWEQVSPTPPGKPESCAFNALPRLPCWVIYSGSTKEVTPAGNPYSDHSFQEYAWDPRGRLLFTLPSGTWWFDLATKAWTSIRPAGPEGAQNQGVGTRHAFAWDPVLGAHQIVASAGPTRGVYRYDPAANAWIKRCGAPWPACPPGQGQQLPMINSTIMYSTYDPHRGVHYVYSLYYPVAQRWWKYDAVANTWTALPMPPGAAPPNYVPDSFDYDTANRVVVAFNHPSPGVMRVMIYDPDTTEWKVLPDARTPVPPSTHGQASTPMAARYLESLNAFVFLAGHRGAQGGGPTTTWLYRYRGASEPRGDRPRLPATR